MYLTDRDCDILRTLCFNVRLLTIRQIAGFWWARTSAPTSALRRLKKLRDAGMLDRYDVLARPSLNIESPILVWTPGQPDADFGALARITSSRWTAPPETQTVYIASRFAANWLGGAGGRLHRNDATHDIHVSTIYLLFRRTRPAEAAVWVGEDLLPKAGWRQKDPDVLLFQSGQPTRVIEFAGAYDAKRLAAFHEHCYKNRLAYELW